MQILEAFKLYLLCGSSSDSGQQIQIVLTAPLKSEKIRAEDA